MKISFTLFVAFLLSITATAQAPQKWSYQSVVRNSSDQLVSNAPVGIRISILENSVTGNALYVETHTTTPSPCATDS